MLKNTPNRHGRGIIPFLLSLLSCWPNPIMPRNTPYSRGRSQMCLGGWGRGCGISFVFAARFELHTLTMEQAADAGWKTELFWTQWNTKNIHSDLITESGRVRAHCSCWRWKFWRKKALCFNPSCIFKLKVSLPFIIIILFLRQVQFPLTNRLFIIVIRNDMNKKMILRRTKCLLVLEEQST